MTIRTFEGTAPTLGKDSYVDPDALVLGRVSLGDESSVWPKAVIRGDMHDISIGARTNVQDGCILHITHDSKYTPGGRPLVIGDDVTIGHNAVVHACTVGNRVLIGMNATLLDGCVVEDDVIIGAGAVVAPNTRLESGMLYVGSPAKAIKPISDAQREFLPYSAQTYVKLSKRFAAEYA